MDRPHLSNPQRFGLHLGLLLWHLEACEASLTSTGLLLIKETRSFLKQSWGEKIPQKRLPEAPMELEPEGITGRNADGEIDLVLEASDIVSFWSLCSFSNLTRFRRWYSVSTGMSYSNMKRNSWTAKILSFAFLRFLNGILHSVANSLWPVTKRFRARVRFELLLFNQDRQNLLTIFVSHQLWHSNVNMSCSVIYFFQIFTWNVLKKPKYSAQLFKKRSLW